ncbi:hypothetical protein EI94DRAFT_1798242 [Lactarius quietus]|nr:hypothetical protein EI94DRAFT_1798242 [Lactarius quietus]
MNRLSTVLYIRSTLASSRANINKSGSDVNGDAERTGVGSDETSEESGPSALASALESGATTASDSGSYGPSAVRRDSLLSSELHSPSSSPFRGVKPTGDTPAWVDDDPFEDVVVESISVGSVPVHTPHLTDPIAPFAGFAMQAEVVKNASKYTEFRKAQKRTFLDKGSKAEESEGGLFFASRERGRTSQLEVSNDELFSVSKSDERPSQQPPVDYLQVDIPDISIALPGTESGP